RVAQVVAPRLARALARHMAEHLLLDQISRATGEAVADAAEEVHVARRAAAEDARHSLLGEGRDRHLPSREQPHPAEGAATGDLHAEVPHLPAERRLHALDRLREVDRGP